MSIFHLQGKILNILKTELKSTPFSAFKDKREEENELKNQINLKKAALFALVLALIVSATTAAIMVSLRIDLFMRVKRSISMGVYDLDAKTNLVYINLGDFLWNTAKNFPNEAPEQTYFINNTDQMDLYISFNVENLPQDDSITFRLCIKRGDQPTWATGLAPNEIYGYPLISRVNNPEPGQDFAHWYIRVMCNQPDFGDYSPILWFHGHDRSTG